MNNKHLSWYKEINNNFIIASRAYFLQWCWCRSPPWSIPPPAERRKRPQDGISRAQKVATVEIGFCRALGCFQGIWVHIGERSRLGEPRGAHESGGRAQGGWAPPYLVASSKLPWCVLQVSRIASVPKVTLLKVSFCLDSVLYSFSSKHWNRKKNSNLGWASG